MLDPDQLYELTDTPDLGRPVLIQALTGFVDAGLAQHPRGDVVPSGEQAEQQMFGADMPVPQLPGLPLRADHHLPGRLGEPLEHQ